MARNAHSWKPIARVGIAAQAGRFLLRVVLDAPSLLVAILPVLMRLAATDSLTAFLRRLRVDRRAGEVRWRLR
jgi:hypothetical protein